MPKQTSNGTLAVGAALALMLMAAPSASAQSAADCAARADRAARDYLGITGGACGAYQKGEIYNRAYHNWMAGR